MALKLRAWLRDRSLPALIALLLVAVGVGQALLWWMAPPPSDRGFVGPPRSGYTLTDFRLVQYAEDGRPSFIITAPQLERREGDESLYINAPKFELPSREAAVPGWHGQSLYGWVNKDGSLLKLQGPVSMLRPAFDATAATTIHTADVTAWPKQNRLQTAAAAQVVQGGTRISGVGMRANLNEKHLELLDDVHAIYPPRHR